METPASSFTIRSKIWIADGSGSVVFGLGRYRILEAVREAGSLNAAAKLLKMSYRAVWMRVRTSEARIGRPLVIRQGKGSCLTPFAEALMTQFADLLRSVQRESDRVYQNLNWD
ncbi:MAG: LysR family transcriptional regulator [Pseudomonadota bacterium]